MKSSLLLLIGILCWDSANSWRCHQGFNATILDVPLYHWDDEFCDDCFMQELTFPFLQTDMEVSIRYGGCLNQDYAKYVTCQELFGKDSNLEATTIYQMLPTLHEFFNDIERNFRYRITESYRGLFSNGTSMDSFVDGCYTLLGNLGLNTTAAEPLRNEIPEFLDVVLPVEIHWRTGLPERDHNKTDEEKTIAEFLDSFGDVVEAYKKKYPNSEIPDIVRRFAQYVRRSYNLGSRDRCEGLYFWDIRNYTAKDICEEQYDNNLMKLNREAIDAAVDLQFAIDNEFEFDFLDLIEDITKVFPDSNAFTGFVKALDRDDIKQLYKDFYKYSLLLARNTFDFDSLVGAMTKAFSGTVARIASKISVFTKGLKENFLPRTCKFMSCSGRFCNKHSKLSEVKAMVINAITTTESTMPSSTTPELTTPKWITKNAEVANSTITSEDRILNMTKGPSSDKIHYNATSRMIPTTSSSSTIYGGRVLGLVSIVLLCVY